ncbi:hypothetical protein KHU32_09840 [Roseococcus sp. XZZS9]|uniref:Cyclic GMP-AMP synthase n=1 Tax=Roseococcus pinisoli TaxID=2835040 RepID=A0ABS5QCV5_9PROT|nr:hypothetical protein [Roseococcus pinisoli]
MATNFHRVLRGSGTKPDFLGAITLSETEENALRDARNVIRECIRTAFRTVADDSLMAKRLLLNDAPPLYRTDEFLRGFRPTPRFRGQGSYSYRTLNDPVPQHTPPQHVDLDDGTFLPTSFLSQSGRPAIAAKAYFKVIEDALRPLCIQRGWTLCDKGPDCKPSCVRVLLDRKTHIDLPLYAIPDDDFEKLEKALHSQGLTMDAAEFGDQVYRSLPEDRIMLARRDGSWVQSDPRKLHDWFIGAVSKHNPHLRHVCRYLKAWRDQQWVDPEAGISSITLMAMAVTAFEENRRFLDASREDEALIAVADRMPALLKGPIRNPVLPKDPEANLDADWTDAARVGFITAAQKLREALHEAQSATRADVALAQLTKCLGKRVPADESLVDVLASEEETILARPRTYIPATVVGRTNSG